MTHRFGIVGNGRGEEIAPEVDTSDSDELEVFDARDDIDIITVATPSGLHNEAVTKAAVWMLRSQSPEFWKCEWTIKISDAKVVRDKLVECLTRISRNMRADVPWHEDVDIVVL